MTLTSLLAALICCAPLSAQTLGRVQDVTTRGGVEGAVVTLAIAGTAVETSQNGSFQFQTTVQVPDTIVVSHPDYVTARIPLGRMPEGWYLTVRLTPRPESGADE